MSGVSADDLRQRFQNDVASGRGLTARRPSRQLRGKLDAAPIRRAAVYEAPYLAHAPMEPMNCTARVTRDRCEVWVGSQVPGISRKVAAEISGLPQSRVTVHSTLLGGGFGRRSKTDFVAEAVTLSAATRKPIKVVWSREDDTRSGAFRPCSYHQIEGAVSASGELIGLVHQIACQSVYANLAPEIADAMLPGMKSIAELAGGLFAKYVDPTSVEGSADTEYEIPDFGVEYFPQRVEVPVGAWRSVGHSFNSFVIETFLDELAEAAGQDRVEFRRRLLARSPRLRGVLEEVAALAGWSRPTPPGLARGVACNKSFESYVAAVAEVAIDGDRIVPQRIVIGIDCGEVVNPDIVRAQLEGAAIFGLSAALKGKITLQGGRVVQSNFHDYEVIRMFEAPRIETHLVASTAAPTGVGEPGVPVIAPAIANAVAALTGRRLRVLPLSLA
jgi:CO/xanthine dehydrogenase Mo-binding subunit